MGVNVGACLGGQGTVMSLPSFRSFVSAVMDTSFSRGDEVEKDAMDHDNARLRLKCPSV